MFYLVECSGKEWTSENAVLTVLKKAMPNSTVGITAHNSKLPIIIPGKTLKNEGLNMDFASEVRAWLGGKAPTADGVNGKPSDWAGTWASLVSPVVSPEASEINTETYSHQQNFIIYPLPIIKTYKRSLIFQV